MFKGLEGVESQQRMFSKLQSKEEAIKIFNTYSWFLKTYKTRNRWYFTYLDNEYLSTSNTALRARKGQGFLLSSLLFYTVLEVLSNTVRKEIRNKKYMFWKRRKQNCHYLKLIKIIFMMYLLKSTVNFLENSLVIWLNV